jgi:hypothetical protein
LQSASKYRRWRSFNFVHSGLEELHYSGRDDDLKIAKITTGTVLPFSDHVSLQIKTIHTAPVLLPSDLAINGTG